MRKTVSWASRYDVVWLGGICILLGLSTFAFFTGMVIPVATVDAQEITETNETVYALDGIDDDEQQVIKIAINSSDSIKTHDTTFDGYGTKYVETDDGSIYKVSSGNYGLLLLLTSLNSILFLASGVLLYHRVIARFD